MTEGQTKNCGYCKTPLIHVKIISTWNGSSEEKLQWQNVADSKPHFKWAGEEPDGKAKYNCLMPKITTSESTVQETVEQPKKEPVNLHVKVAGPFDEAELITRWAADRAYKMVMVEVSDYSRLTPQEKSALGQKTGMLTRCLVDTTLKLMEIHGIKTDYGASS